MATACALPMPEIVDCYFDTNSDPHLLAMRLDWPTGDSGSHVWNFPQNAHLVGGLPERFGIEVHRHAENAYAVRLLWDQSRLHWPRLTRQEIRSTSLSDVLAALHTDLEYLLDQPVSASA